MTDSRLIKISDSVLLIVPGMTEIDKAKRVASVVGQPPALQTEAITKGSMDQLKICGDRPIEGFADVQIVCHFMFCNLLVPPKELVDVKCLKFLTNSDTVKWR